MNALSGQTLAIDVRGMNTKAELVKAAEDYQAGRMGHLS